MDENTHLPEGIFGDPDESILKPRINTKGSSVTPVNEPVIPETLQVTQSLWPDADSVTPAPVSVSSKPDVPAVAAPLGTPPGTPPGVPLGTPPGIPLSTPPEHVSASSLIGSFPTESRPVTSVSSFAGQPTPAGQLVPDPRAHTATFSERDSFPTSESKTNIEPPTPRDLGSTTEYPPLKMIGVDAVAPAMGARLSAYQKSTAADRVSSNTPVTSGVSVAPAAVTAPGTPTISSAPSVSNASAAPAASVPPSIPSIPVTPSVAGAPSTSGEPSATQVEPIRLEVRTKVVEPAAYNKPVTQSAPVAPMASVAPVAPIAPATYGEPNESVGQVTLNFSGAASEVSGSSATQADQVAQTTQAERANWTPAEEPVAQATTEQPVLIPAAQTIPEETPVAEPIEETAVAAVEQITREQLAVASADQLSPEAERPETVFGEPIEVEEEPIEKGISVITREATVLGDILTEGHIDIVGRVKGNIDAKGDVAIHGIVRGDVDGSKIGLYSCRVKGNLNAGLGVIVDDNSIIGGDVKTKNIIFDGKVKGNIDADNVVVLRSHSYCLGDVSAASLAVEPGAILNGIVRTLVDGDLEAPFDEVM